jgi:hypothetical protein
MHRPVCAFVLAAVMAGSAAAQISDAVVRIAVLEGEGGLDGERIVEAGRLLGELA